MNFYKDLLLIDIETTGLDAAKQEIIQRVDAGRVIQLVLGRGLKSAQTELEKNLPLQNSPQIEMSPSWWQWLPMLPFRIEVVTD